MPKQIKRQRKPKNAAGVESDKLIQEQIKEIVKSEQQPKDKGSGEAKEVAADDHKTFTDKLYVGAGVYFDALVKWTKFIPVVICWFLTICFISLVAYYCLSLVGVLEPSVMLEMFLRMLWDFISNSSVPVLITVLFLKRRNIFINHSNSNKDD